MSFPIKPHDILSLMEDSVAALAASPASVRRAYVCVIMAAHLAEHVAAAKGYDVSEYRDRIELEEPALKLVRDLGNYAKHVHITRYTPEAGPIAVSGATSLYRSLADTIDDDDGEDGSEDATTEGFYVQDGLSQARSLLVILRSVIFFWREELLRLSLWP